jgi:hypothetical protein
MAGQGVRPFSKSNQEGRNAGKEEAGKIFSFFPIFLIHILGCLDDPMPSSGEKFPLDESRQPRI